MDIEIENHQVRINEKYLEQSRKEIRRQLREYLDGKRKEFELEIVYPDSFTGEVMKQMSGIPYGQTVSYGYIAGKLDTAPVAVGQACGRNPVPLIVPCHRVVGKNSLGGYRLGKELKKKLLDLETENPGSR